MLTDLDGTSDISRLLLQQVVFTDLVWLPSRAGETECSSACHVRQMDGLCDAAGLEGGDGCGAGQTRRLNVLLYCRCVCAHLVAS